MNFGWISQSPKRVERIGLKSDILWIIEELLPLVKFVSGQQIFACQLVVKNVSLIGRPYFVRDVTK